MSCCSAASAAVASASLARVKGDRDPGYGSTSRIISECALALVQDIDRKTTSGGVWTPAAALGMTVLPRLQERAGLSFALESGTD
jgi:short subunit dehydrogenase-like uncharacterized protein